jgi:sialic acid synthase SpsE
MLALPKPHGYSDHTLGTLTPVMATAMGAAIIEKHLTLDRSNGGPDAAFSLEPREFLAMVTKVRKAHSALGNAGASEDIYRSLRVTA